MDLKETNTSEGQGLEEKHKLDELFTWTWWYCWKFFNGKRCDLPVVWREVGRERGELCAAGSRAAAVLSQGWLGSVWLWLYHDILSPLSEVGCVQNASACCPGLPPGLWLGCFGRRQVVPSQGGTRGCSHSLTCWTELLCSGPICEGITQKTSMVPVFLPTELSACCHLCSTLPSSYPRVWLSVEKSGIQFGCLIQARSSSHFQVFFLKLVKNTSQQLNWVLSSSSVGEIQSSTVYILKPRALASLSSHFVVTTSDFSTCIQFIPKNLRQQLIKMTVNQLLWTKQQQFCKRSVAASWVKTCSSPFSAFISSAAITFWGNICSPLWENPPFPELFFPVFISSLQPLCEPLLHTGFLPSVLFPLPP